MSLVLWGRRALKVQAEVRAALEQIKEQDEAAHRLLWDTFSQGQGHAPASGDTHAEGYAVDFSLNDRRWNSKVAIICYEHLRKNGFAPVIRYRGELGPTNPAHIHAALIPHSNSAEIRAADKAGKRTVYTEVAKVFPQRSLDV